MEQKTRQVSISENNNTSIEESDKQLEKSKYMSSEDRKEYLKAESNLLNNTSERKSTKIKVKVR